MARLTIVGTPPQHDDPEQVILRISIGIGACAQKVQKRRPREIGAQREQQGHRRAAPNAEGGDKRDLPSVLRAQHSGNQAAPAQSKQVAQSGQQVEPRGNQRDRSHHQRIANLADEKGVRQIVDHRHHLADDRGDRQGCDRPPNGHFLKQILLRLFLHRSKLPSFFCKSLRPFPTAGRRKGRNPQKPRLSPAGTRVNCPETRLQATRRRWESNRRQPRNRAACPPAGAARRRRPPPLPHRR